MAIPPPPPGFTLTQSQPDIPPPPPGFTMQQGVRGYTPMQFRGTPEDRRKKYIQEAGGEQSDQFINALVAARRAGDDSAARLLEGDVDFATRQQFDPTKGMGGVDLFRAGVGSSLVGTAQGVGGLVGIVDGEQVAETRRLNEPLMNTGAGFGGNVTGTVGQIVGPGVVLKGAAAVPNLARAAPQLNAASRVFLPTTIRGSALSGAGFGAIQPAVTGEERVQNVVMGAASGGAGAAIPRAIGATRNAFSGLTGSDRAAANLVREAVPDIEQVLAQGAPSRVPGVVRTVAEETLDPRLVNLDRAYRTTGGTRLSERALANNQARVSQLQRIAGTEEDLVSAIAARNVGTAPLRSQALKAESVDITTALSRLSKAEKALEGNPSIQSGIARVRALLANANKKAPDTPASAILNAAGNPMTPAVKGAVQGADMRELYNIRQEIGAMLSGTAGGESKEALKNARQLILARDSIDNAIAARVPEFRQYLSEFQRLSGDVNRLQFGQELMRSAVKDLGDAGASIMPGQFMAKTAGIASTNPRAGANRLAQTATGFRKAKAGNVLPEADAQMLGAIRDDVGREVRVGQIASQNAGGGSQTALMEELKRGAVRSLSRFLPRTIDDAVQGMAEGAQKRLAVAVGDALADPQKMKAILSRFPADERRVAVRVFGALGISGAPIEIVGQ